MPRRNALNSAKKWNSKSEGNRDLDRFILLFTRTVYLSSVFLSTSDICDTFLSFLNNFSTSNSYNSL